MKGNCVIRLPTVRRAFTLMESLMASAILFAGVLAVISAVMTGQKQAFEAQRRLAATLIAEEIMSEVALTDYADLSGIPAVQPAGEFMAVVMVTTTDQELTNLGVRVKGSQIDIEIIPSITEYMVLARISHFIPEPQS